MSKTITMSRVRNQKGFSLIELMIAVAILGIIAAIAYPNYSNYVQQARRSDGHLMLTEIMGAQERFYTENFNYTTDLSELGYTVDGGAVESDEGFYLVTAAACGGSTIRNCVNLTATAQGIQAVDDECATLSLNSRGEKAATGGGGREECW